MAISWSPAGTAVSSSRLINASYVGAVPALVGHAVARATLDLVDERTELERLMAACRLELSSWCRA